jgi:hypothetical protein
VTRRATLVAALAVGLLVGLGVPLLDLALDCRVRTSEACVWGRALLGVSLSVGAVLGLIAGTITYFVVRSVRGRPP